MSDKENINTHKMAFRAGARVFGILELVEQIFLNYTVEECTRAMQISKFCWNAVIGSSKLRRRMFLERDFSDTEVLSYKGEIITQSRSCCAWRGNTITHVHPALGNIREKKLPRKMMRLMDERFPRSIGLRQIVLKVDKRKIESWGAGMWESMLITKGRCGTIFIEHSGRKGMLEVKALTLGELRNHISDKSKRSHTVRVVISGFVEESSKQVVRAREKIAAELVTKSQIERWLALQDLEEAD